MPEITNDVMYPLEKSTMIVDDVLNLFLPPKEARHLFLADLS